MAESHVVSALVNKRAEIAGMIARTEQHSFTFASGRRLSIWLRLRG
jgi:hypothetical protein